MDQEQFWTLIEKSKQDSTNGDEQAEKLTHLLVALDAQEIIEFGDQMHDRLYEAYRWDLWAVAHIIHGACGDDSFEYFGCWLISQGRVFFETVLKEPEHAADRVVEGEYAMCEAILYVSMDAYERKTGQEMLDAIPNPTPSDLPDVDLDLDLDESYGPKGKAWREADLKRMYPELWRRFGKRSRGRNRHVVA